MPNQCLRRWVLRKRVHHVGAVEGVLSVVQNIQSNVHSSECLHLRISGRKGSMSSLSSRCNASTYCTWFWPRPSLAFIQAQEVPHLIALDIDDRTCCLLSEPCQICTHVVGPIYASQAQNWHFICNINILANFVPVSALKCFVQWKGF